MTHKIIKNGLSRKSLIFLSFSNIPNILETYGNVPGPKLSIPKINKFINIYTNCRNPSKQNNGEEMLRYIIENDHIL